MKNILLILALAIVLFSCTEPAKDGFILHNVNGYTLDSGGDLIQFEAIAVENGKVTETGTLDELETEDRAGLERLDGEGKTLLPGLIDAHTHVMGLGIQELDVNVAGIRSLEETLQTVADFAEANEDREWILGRGWNQVLWEENEFPTAADLDRVISDRPVFLTRVDGHAGWANTRAMELAGIDQDTPDPQGGMILRDEAGEATGIFVDASMRYIREQIPERSDSDYERALELALAETSKHGLTSVHDARTDVYEWNLYKSFADNGRLKTRIYAMIAGTGETFDEMAANGIVESYADDLLSLRSVKISADGALGSRGAAMLEDYHDEPGNKGLLFYDQQELNEMLLKGASAGFQMNIHAIGDAANRQVLDAFDYIFERLDNQEELRHRIEHAQIVALEDIPRFLDYNLIASMQPTHATSDMNMAEDRVGAERIKGAYAWQTFLDQGTVIAGGSDFPVEDVNPFYGLYSAVTRQDHEGMPPGGWYSEHKMSRIEALRAFTLDAAFAGHQEDELGTLEAGKWADFILIDRDFFEVPASEIWETEVLETWVKGEKVYSSSGS
jgi:predicted amidohydrolase YtcJ